MNIEFEGCEERLTIYDGRIHLPALKETFGLATVKINGRIEPVDEREFTITRYSPHTTVRITG